MYTQEMTATAVANAPQGTLSISTYELSFNTEDGTFTLTGGPSPQPNPILKPFQIIVTEPSTLTINAVSPLAFSTSATGSPYEPLPFNSVPGLTLIGFSASSIEITVDPVPSPSAVLGFQLYTSYTTNEGTIEGILTPSFFVTQPIFAPQSHSLTYVPENGSFLLTGMEIPVTKATVLLRLGNADGNQGGDMRFTLSGATFADPPALVTSGAATVIPVPPDGVLIASSFEDGTSFGVSFAVQVDGVTILSPDPIIVDKEIGSGGT